MPEQPEVKVKELRVHGVPWAEGFKGQVLAALQVQY